ncbi:Putative Impact family protein [Rhizopus microsporus]|nr:Putative Impact family protein [Rhizopus microsporus]
MNKEQELENRELQAQEIEALEAIFPEDFKKDPSSPDAYTFTINLDQDDDQVKSPRTLTLRFFLPPTYPMQDMPIYEVSSIYCGAKKVDDTLLDAIDQGFTSLFEPTQIVLFEWISWLREFLEQHVEKSHSFDQQVYAMQQLSIEEKEEDQIKEQKEGQIEEQEEDQGHDRPMVRALMGSHFNESPPKIFSSEPLIDRKSVFVAHVAKVDNIHQVKLVISCLLENKKIAKATHNILAYRITMPDGKVLQDNDDDGETAAGSRLLHLMQILQVENAVVIVTRWYGGVPLGPDRFKDINNIARTALEQYGFIKQPSKHSNKKGKK